MHTVTVHNFSCENLYYHCIIYVLDAEFGKGTLIENGMSNRSEYIVSSTHIPCNKNIFIIDGYGLMRGVEYVREHCHDDTGETIIIASSVITCLIRSCIKFNLKKILWLGMDCTKEEFIISLCDKFSVVKKKTKKTIRLTVSELMTAKYLLYGYSNKDISLFLNKDERTISYFKKNIVRKLQVDCFSLPLNFTTLSELKRFIDCVLK